MPTPDAEKSEIVAGSWRAGSLHQPPKGLGENEPDMMWLTTMNPETRRLIKVMPEEWSAPPPCLTCCWGQPPGQKDHIAENGYKYLELADIS